MKEISVGKENFLEALTKSIAELVGETQRPVMVFSSAWPFLKELNENKVEAVESLLDLLIDIVGPKRTLIMPTFARGFVDGVADLDNEKSTTGAFSECFRKRPESKRTKSAFFPFSVQGPDSQELFNLTPRHAWGEGSVYEWFEKKDGLFLMLGTHPTHCSYLHRIELLLADKINYRYNKTFQGSIIREGKSEPFTETLYVRKLDPAVVNDFTVLLPHLHHAKMNLISLNGISLASYGANDILKVILPALSIDPFLTVKNRSDYEV